VQFTLPDCEASSGWKLLLDTNDPDLPQKDFDIDDVYDVTGRSLLLFERVPGQRKTPKKVKPTAAAKPTEDGKPGAKPATDIKPATDAKPAKK
jgi:hypothetical protein